MAVPSDLYRVGLILTNPLTIHDYKLSVDNITYNISFQNGTSEKYCDLIITDKEPSELSSMPKEQKGCHGSILAINKMSNPLLEQQYESIFTKSDFIKYKSIQNLSNKPIIKLINKELIKQLAMKNKISNVSFWTNKDIFPDLLRKFTFDLGWLLVPYVIIIFYLLSRIIGYSSSSLCESAFGYNPDCKKSIFEELKFLAFVYSIFSFKFYYDYILSIFDNINNDVFQSNNKKLYIHKLLQFFIPLVLFASALIICKALFVFLFGFEIAEEYGFISIGLIFDKYMPIFKDSFLIGYFLVLDFLLYLIAKNFSRVDINNLTSYSSNRQKNYIKEAQNSFFVSASWDACIIIGTAFFLNSLLSDEQSKLAVQLIVLQSAYLYINLKTIGDYYKYT